MFDKIIGNDRTLALLTTMISEGTLPHAIILEGDMGLGTHAVANELCKALLCSETEVGFCDKCKSCVTVEEGSHADLKVVYPGLSAKEKNGIGAFNRSVKYGRNISVDNIRVLINDSVQKPFGERKVYVIDKAETMTEEAQNSLLKIIEEPPAYATFILIVKSSAMLLETILSRCAVFSFEAPSESGALEVVKSKLGGADGGMAEATLKAVDNNIGKALFLIRRFKYFNAKPIYYEGSITEATKELKKFYPYITEEAVVYSAKEEDKSYLEMYELFKDKDYFREACIGFEEAYKDSTKSKKEELKKANIPICIRNDGPIVREHVEKITDIIYPRINNVYEVMVILENYTKWGSALSINDFLDFLVTRFRADLREAYISGNAKAEPQKLIDYIEAVEKCEDEIKKYLPVGLAVAELVGAFYNYR